MASFLPAAFDRAHGAPRRLAVATGDSRLQVWDVLSGDRATQLTEPNHLAATYTCVALQAGEDAGAGPKRKKAKKAAGKAGKAGKAAGHELGAVGTKSGAVVVWDVTTGEVLHRLGEGGSDGHAQAVNDLAFSPCGTRLYSCSDDRRVIAWDLGTGKAAQSFRAGKRPVRRIAVRPDGAALLTAGSGVKLWDLATGQVLQKYAGHASEVGCLAFAADGKVFVSGAADRYLHVWDADARGKGARQPSAVLALDFRPVSARVAGTASAEYTVVAVSEAGTAGVWRWERPAEGAADALEAASRAPGCRITVQVGAAGGAAAGGKRRKKKGKAGAAGGDRGSVRASAQDGAIIDAQLLDEHRVLLVRGSGIRPTFEELPLADPAGAGQENAGALRAHVELPSLSARLYSAGAPGVDGALASRKRKAAGQADDGVQVLGAAEAGAGRVRLARHAAMVGGPAAAGAAAANGEAGGATADEVAAAVAAGVTPAAGSLQVVLSQALKTGDEGMIEQCIGTHNAAVIRRTVDRLPTRDILPFLRRLVAKFQSKPSRGPHLLMWVQEILTRHCSYLTSVPGLASELSGLFQTVDARLAVFKKLLNLSGRLDLMLSQINVRQAGAAAAAAAAADEPTGPLATYEEGEGDDDDDEDVEDDDEEEEEQEDEDEEEADESMSDSD